MKKTADSKKTGPEKKRYTPPRLTQYGTLRTITGGNMKNKTEATGGGGGASAKTKLGGPG